MSSNPQPLAGRSEADGPLFEYTLYVFYPNEGGRVTESGWSVARQLAARLRDEAANVERTAGISPQASSAERSEEELLHDVARAIRDAYEQLPNGTAPEFTNVSDWYGEARAAIDAVRGERS